MPATIKNRYRSGLEEAIAKQLEGAGTAYGYESIRVEYHVPARISKYLPDFTIKGTNIIIEGKGSFGAIGSRFVNFTANSAKERQKFALLKEQHPEYDIRFVFSKASAPIYKGSPTTHAKWATDHGFKWCEKVIPPGWFKEIRDMQAKQAKRKKS